MTTLTQIDEFRLVFGDTRPMYLNIYRNALDLRSAEIFRDGYEAEQMQGDYPHYRGRVVLHNDGTFTVEAV